MSNSPLQLNRSVFTDVRLTAQPDVPDTQVELQMETIVEYQAQVSNANPRNWVLTVRVHIKSPNEKPTMYVGTVQCIGAFTVAPEWPADQIEKLVVVNGCGMLYSSIREMVSIIVARGPYVSPPLPSMSFVGMYEQSKQKSKAQGAETAKRT